MLKIKDFNIVSTNCDSLLFFNESYREAVEEEINNLIREEDVKILGLKLNLICGKSSIEISDRRENPKIKLWGLLGNYR